MIPAPSSRFALAFLLASLSLSIAESAPSYPIVDTSQETCYDNNRAIAFPGRNQPFFGQDAQYATLAPNYKDNGDGTISDSVTGLAWVKDPGEKKTFQEAKAEASKCRAGGHSDWRLPTIKELYSLILFSGTDIPPESSNGSRPFLDTRFFGFRYGDPARGERIIDAQYWSGTEYSGTTMGKNPTVFGVNFADGRIKGYPRDRGARGEANKQFARFVRGNSRYGTNDFSDNGNGTVTDNATGLIWQKADSGKGMDWENALAYAENLALGGQDDWRLPNAKELQSIVDYRRSPSASRSAAIDPIFQVTPVRNEAGETDYPHFWTSTTHASANGRGNSAVYVAFGRAMGFFHGKWMDVHGAGAQRSDPKTGDASAYPQGRGPQGDAVRIQNFVRCVRGGNAVTQKKETFPVPEKQTTQAFPQAPPGKFVARLDKNGDGKVSIAEFDGPKTHFGFLDRDHDGFLSEEEAPPPPKNQKKP